MKFKNMFFLQVFMVICFSVSAQDMKKFNLYKPADDVEASLATVMKEAKENNKHIFIQIGGNWCVWCARFNEFITHDASIDSLVKTNYVVYHLNYSKENYNQRILAKYGFPQRFGFPVFLVLDAKGKLLHTQNSVYLEEGKGYNREKVMEFFSHWTPAALDPANYKEK